MTYLGQNPVGVTAGGLVNDVKVDGTSVVQNGVAEVPKASSDTLGTIKVNSNYGIDVNSSGNASIKYAATDIVKLAGNGTAVQQTQACYRPVTPINQHSSAFYGLAKAAGDTTQSASSNAVGTYTEDAKSKISDMLNAPVSVSGTTPSITAMAGVRYICGECSTLSITTPASGIIDVVFESGSTATVLTVTSAKTGVSAIKWANGFNPSSLDANTKYEISVMDGELGAALSWT